MELEMLKSESNKDSGCITGASINSKDLLNTKGLLMEKELLKSILTIQAKPVLTVDNLVLVPKVFLFVPIVIIP